MLKHGSDIAPKWVAPEDEQAPYESRRLCRDLTRGILAKDMDTMTESKTVVEEVKWYSSCNSACCVWYSVFRFTHTTRGHRCDGHRAGSGAKRRMIASPTVQSDSSVQSLASGGSGHERSPTRRSGVC